MANREKRGCGVLFPSAAMIFGLAGCAWAFFLGSVRGGDTVSATVGWSFWLGWGCGIPLFVLGTILFIIQRLIRAAGDTAGRFVEDRASVDDFLPNLGFLDDLFRR
jgi:hypothetical protein